MGVRIIVGPDGACFYDSVTEKVFGMKMEDEEEAESFQNYVEEDLRMLSHDEFVSHLKQFRKEREE